MKSRILTIASFLMMLSLYTALIVVLTPLVPEAFLMAVGLWLLIRCPWRYPDRIDQDVQALSAKMAQGVKAVLEFLFRPLRDL